MTQASLIWPYRLGNPSQLEENFSPTDIHATERISLLYIQKGTSYMPPSRELKKQSISSFSIVKSLLMVYLPVFIFHFAALQLSVFPLKGCMHERLIF